MNSFTTDAMGKAVGPVGDDLAGVAVQHNGFDVGPRFRRVGGGLTDAGVESAEWRRRLGGWAWGSAGSEACGGCAAGVSAVGGVPKTCASQPLTSSATQTTAILAIAHFVSRRRISLLRADPEPGERGQRCAHRLPQPNSTPEPHLTGLLQRRLTSLHDTPKSCQSSPAFPVNLRCISTPIGELRRSEAVTRIRAPIAGPLRLPDGRGARRAAITLTRVDIVDASS